MLLIKPRQDRTSLAAVWAMVVLLSNVVANGQHSPVTWNQFRGPNG